MGNQRLNEPKIKVRRQKGRVLCKTLYTLLQLHLEVTYPIMGDHLLPTISTYDPVTKPASLL